MSVSVVVREKSAFPEARGGVRGTPVAVWRDYLTVRYLHSRADYLPKKVDDTDFAFYGTVHRRAAAAAAARHPRRAAARSADGRGARQALLWRATFRRRPRRKIQQLVANLLKAYEADIQTLDLDDPGDAGQGAGEDPHVHRQDRLPGHVARLLGARHLAPGPARATCSNAQVFEWNRRLEPARRAGRPRRVGHDAADQQRLLQPDAQRDRVPGRHPAAALLRSERRRRGELRRDRRHHRPRDQPRLRRPGQQVRRHRASEQLVDGRGPQGLRRAHRAPRASSTTSTSRCPACT